MTLFGESPEQAQAVIDQCPLLALARESHWRLQQADMVAVAGALGDLIRDYYVHLPLKRSALAIDPVQELSLLQDDVRFGLDHDTFVARLRRTVVGMRDRHTSIEMPWGGAIAFLPVLVEGAWQGSEQVLVVTKVLGTLDAPGFEPGAVITHWNAVPVATWVRSVAETTDGANPAARIAVALRSLTIRPLAYQPAPDEDWVTISYVTPQGMPGAVTVPWRIYTAPQAPSSAPSGSARGAARAVGDLALGLDRGTLAVNNSLRDLFSGAAVVAARPQRTSDVTPRESPPALAAVTTSTVTVSGRTYGYLRIFSFEAPDASAWVQAMSQLLTSLPQDGLIVDVRSNPGGAIPAAEALLCMLTRRTVLPSRLEFRLTDATAAVIANSQFFVPWQRSAAVRFDTGEIFSQGFSLLDPSLVADHIGIYSGPSILINDALSYSATDFFSAGWQDNGIGPIIGIDGLSGAGGANVWTYSQIAALAGLPATLPGSIGVNLSVRRSTRVLANEGMPVEGLGVQADVDYRMTVNDVLGDNVDLMLFAGRLLSTAPRTARPA